MQHYRVGVTHRSIKITLGESPKTTSNTELCRKDPLTLAFTNERHRKLGNGSSKTYIPLGESPKRTQNTQPFTVTYEMGGETGITDTTYSRTAK